MFWGRSGRVCFLEYSHLYHVFINLFLTNVVLFLGWGLGGIPGSEAERTTCPNKRGRDKTEFCH